MPPHPAAATTYGQYILQTGQGTTARLEQIWGRFFYESRFKGCHPVADVGSGRCWFTRQSPHHIVAIDNAPDLVHHYSPMLQIRQGSADAIPFPGSYFEAVFCCWLFEHLNDPEPAMHEFQRVLKPGGFCSIVVPTPADLQAFYADYTHVRPFTAASLRQLAEAARFSRVRIQHLPWSRGLRPLCRRFGESAGLNYVRFADRYLRHLGLRNRAHLIMDAWK